MLYLAVGYLYEPSQDLNYLRYTSFNTRRDDHLTQNIPARSAFRHNRPNETFIARTEIFVSPNHTSEFRLMGDIESSYNTSDGYFRHKIVLDPTQEVSNSVCYGMLKLRNGDQLLSINNEDTTLISHEDALSVFENLPSNNDENITMTYRRPTTRNVVDISFKLNCSLGSAVDARINNESSVPESDWIKKSAVTIQNRGTNRYMQALEKNCVMFKELVSSIPGQRPKDFHICHFTEERWIESNSGALLRRFIDEEHKDYLHVTYDGNIILSSTCSVFKLKVESMRAFVIIEEIITGKVLCINDFNDCCAKFIHPTNYADDQNCIDHMEEKFRFERDSVTCLRQ
ncbi:TTLL11 [Mytilus coruscus]|uniref:TTLL11 n=1 Tax=Mytilus coruscus TaxID=42192 RepID=A0A6J8BPB5_MYTCO|nr:TTLL11 [Mytilus coruscus]